MRSLDLFKKNSSSKRGAAERASFVSQNSTEVFRQKKLFPQVNQYRGAEHITVLTSATYQTRSLQVTLLPQRDGISNLEVYFTLRCLQRCSSSLKKQKSLAIARLPYIQKRLYFTLCLHSKLCIKNRTRKKRTKFKKCALGLVQRTVVQALGQLVSLN